MCGRRRRRDEEVARVARCLWLEPAAGAGFAGADAGDQTASATLEAAVDLAFIDAKTAGDWLTVGPDHTATLEIRVVFATDDGATIFMQSHGRADARTFGSGGTTWLAPRFETDAPAYRWLTTIQAVARGAGAAKAIAFELYELR